jgi:hypothetical protein
LRAGIDEYLTHLGPQAFKRGFDQGRASIGRKGFVAAHAFAFAASQEYKLRCHDNQFTTGRRFGKGWFLTL